MHIESSLPLWLVLPLVALAVFVVWIIYLKKQDEPVLPKPIRTLLGISRFLVIFIVGLLIISPWIRTTVSRKNKPYFIIAQDNSVSITPTADPAGYLAKRAELVNRAVKSLDDRYEVKQVLFGSQTADGSNCTFTEPVTHAGELFNYLRVFAQTHDLGGVLITSDGVATQGPGFSEAGRNFPFLVTILASGDSTRFPDVRIQDVVCNDRVRKNSTFPIRVYYNTGDYSGKKVKLQLSDHKQMIAEKEIQTATHSAPFEEFLVQAPDKGSMQLSVTIVPDQADKNQDNNTKRFSVKVIEQEGNILCLYEAAHPDIDAMVQALKGTESLNVTQMDINDFSGTDLNYDLLILHGLPSVKHPVAELLKSSSDKRIPILFLIGVSTDAALFNRLNAGITLGNRRQSGEAAQGSLNPLFSLFTLEPDFNNHLIGWPPLILGFDTYAADPGLQICMKQKIMGIEMNDPLMAFSNTQGNKYGLICGEGIWLWRMHEYLEQKNHDYFDDWFSRSIQYLMVDETRDRLKIIVPDDLFAYSSVRVNGRLLNSSLETVNDPEMLFTVIDSIGQKTEYQMGRVNDYYELNINGFAPGTYRYSAETKLGNETLKSEGMMTMLVRPIEQIQPVADFASLRSIASGTDGRFFKPGEEDQMITYMKSLNPSELTARKEFRWYDLINFKWLLGFLIVLLSMEWFLRRWYGIR